MREYTRAYNVSIYIIRTQCLLLYTESLFVKLYNYILCFFVILFFFSFDSVHNDMFEYNLDWPDVVLLLQEKKPIEVPLLDSCFGTRFPFVHGAFH